MGFEPWFKVGDVISHSEIVDTFGCGNMGGMKRSHKTNTLILISDYSKGLYHDKWIGGVLHYTGMGKKGDQDLHSSQNATLAESNRNGVEVHLFEVLDPRKYTYCGTVKLAGKPYTEMQLDEDGYDRTVWMFPLEPNTKSFKTPKEYTFASEEEYKSTIKETRSLFPKSSQKREGNGKATAIVGRNIIHKTYGVGVVKSNKDGQIEVRFESGEKKVLNYGVCVEMKLIEIL